MSLMLRDLFGEPIATPSALRKDGARRKVGYAARPGTGPKGKRCVHCQHCAPVLHRGQKTKKCELMAHAWTHGAETDIHLNAPACKKFDRRPLAPLKFK